MQFTTIRIDSEVREQLKLYGKKGETYNEIIKRLLRIANESGSSVIDREIRPRGPMWRPSDFG